MVLPADVAAWHGSQVMFSDLLRAVARNCECEAPTIINPRPPTCPAHKMLTDQRTLDHFLFVGLRAQRYWCNEFLT